MSLLKAYAAHPTVNPNNPAHCFALGTTTATATILQAPEFISDVDPAVGVTKDNYTIPFDSTTMIKPKPLKIQIFTLAKPARILIVMVFEHRQGFEIAEKKNLLRVNRRDT